MNWREFISQYDIVYETPPCCWQDGLLLGNGSLGAIFYADDALEWCINKSDVLDARTRGVKHVIPPDEARRMVRAGATPADFERLERGDPGPHGMGPKTCACLRLEIGTAKAAAQHSAMPAVTSRLRLYDGTLDIALDKHLCHPRIETFVTANRDLFVARVSDVSPVVAWRTVVQLRRPDDVELPAPCWNAGTDRLVLTQELPGGQCFAVGLRIVPRPSSAWRDDVLPRIRERFRPPEQGTVSLTVQGRFGMAEVEGDFDLFLTVASSRDAADPTAEVDRRLDTVVREKLESLRTTHREWWHDYWQRAWIELGDKALEQLFYSSLYILAATYRKAPMPGLPGLCYGENPGPLQASPWAGDLHHDQNVQCPFYAVHTLDRSELFDAYLDTYAAFLPEARRLAREVWNAPGAHFDMCFNAAGKSVLGGVGRYRFFFGGSYVALMHCLCWRTRRDMTQLRNRIYPFLKEVLAFYSDIMTPGPDGRFHLWPAHAPELDVADCRDPVQTISMLKICLETAIEAAELLACDADQAAQWRALLHGLPDYPVETDAAYGDVVVDADGIPPGQHVNQAGGLRPVFPCGEVDDGSPPGTVALYRRTFDWAIARTAQKSFADDGTYYYHCAWQCFHYAMTALRLGLKSEFRDRYLPMFLRSFPKPNGLMSHDAVVIVAPDASEANLSRIGSATLGDGDEEMPAFEPWCGYDGGSTPEPGAKRFCPPLIEGNGDYLTMITEALLQSHGGVINVFPGWSPDKGTAQFSHLVARGRIIVSSRIENGRVRFVTLHRHPAAAPTADGNWRVRLVSPWSGEVLLWSLAPGESLTLSEAGTMDVPPPLEPSTPDTPKPRVFWHDAHATLWVGRQR